MQSSSYIFNHSIYSIVECECFTLENDEGYSDHSTTPHSKKTKTGYVDEPVLSPHDLFEADQAIHLTHLLDTAYRLGAYLSPVG